MASRKLRFIGALVDGVVNAVVYTPVLVLSGVLQPMIAGELSYGVTVLLSVGGIVVFVTINGYLLATAGQTIGKRLVGTRIVNVSDERIPRLLPLLGARYGITWLVGLIPGVGTVYGLVDALFVFRDDRRCVHDLFAGTKVVNAETASGARSTSA